MLIITLLGFAAISAELVRPADALEPKSDVTLEPVIVSASKIPSTAINTSGNATVFTRDEIEAQKAGSIVDLLRQVAGLHIDQLGGRGGISSVYLRGCDPNYTLVMIDGVKVNDPANARGGSYDFSTLNVENVERIEIVRGPLSAVHGSDAIGGVINIVTRHGTPVPEFSVEAQGGGHGYYSGAVAARGPAGENADYALSAVYADNGSQVRGDEYKGSDFHGKINIQPVDETHIQGIIRFHDSHSESFPDDSGGPEFAVLQAVDEREAQEFTTSLEVNHEPLSWLELILKSSWHDRKEDAVSPGVAPGVRDPFGIPANGFQNRFSRTQISAGGVISGIDGFNAGFGIDAEFEKGESDSSIVFFGIPIPGRFEMNRDSYSPFFEAQYEFASGLSLTGGLRVDFPEDFETEYSPRFGAIYKIESSGTTFKANWGKGFKLPSFFALSNPIVGNPNLNPENSKGYDIGVIQAFWNGLASCSITPFFNTLSDVIDFDEGPPPKLVNRSEVTTEGVEVVLDMRPLENLKLAAHLTYTHTDIEGTDEKLRNRPEWRGGINVHWQARSDLGLNLDFLYVGETFDSSIPTGDQTLENYIRVNVAAAWKIQPNLEVGLAVDNLFDEEYQEVIGFPAPGIQPRLSMKFLF